MVSKIDVSDGGGGGIGGKVDTADGEEGAATGLGAGGGATSSITGAGEGGDGAEATGGSGALGDSSPGYLTASVTASISISNKTVEVVCCEYKKATLSLKTIDRDVTFFTEQNKTRTGGTKAIRVLPTEINPLG
jgi:hypothetical protein